MVRDYMEALHWCLNYYHNGCKSWSWFYPHLYSPLMTDMTDLKSFYSGGDAAGFAAFDFDAGKPFPSLVQLLSVLPPQSSTLLPAPYADLMAETSPLTEFYPRVFTTDANGKRQTWESIVQIPFIESSRLMDAVSGIEDETLTNAEKKRNRRGREFLYEPGVEGKVDIVATQY